MKNNPIIVPASIGNTIFIPGMPKLPDGIKEVRKIKEYDKVKFETEVNSLLDLGWKTVSLFINETGVGMAMMVRVR